MAISLKERELLRKILAELQKKADYSDLALDRIYARIWNADAPKPFPRDKCLQDSLLYLSILTEEDRHKTLQQIWSYFVRQRRKARVEIVEMLDQVDREMLEKR